ncbi:MAG: tetratricopeptide repeat protein [Myxococcota bacterium]
MAGALQLGCSTVDSISARQAQTHRDLGSVYLGQGKIELAIREYQSSLELDDRDAETWFAMGEAYRRKGRFPEAEKYLRRALELDDGKQDARLNLSAMYLQQGRWQEAITEAQILVDDPTFLVPARALVNLGFAQYKSGDLEGARQSLTRALETNGSSYQAHADLGMVAYDQGEWVEAASQFRMALRILEGRPKQVFGQIEAEIRFRMAMAQVRLGQRERALDELRISASRGGQSEWGRKSRDYLAILE